MAKQTAPQSTLHACWQSSLPMVMFAMLMGCSGNSEPDNDMIHYIPAQIQEEVTLVAPIMTNVLPQDTGDRNLAASLRSGNLEEQRSVHISEGSAVGSSKGIDLGIPDTGGNVNLGGWWPLRAQTFIHLIQLRPRSDGGGEVAFGRQVSAPRADAKHRVLMEGMTAWIGPRSDNIQSGFDLLALSPASAQVRIHPSTLQEVRVGDSIRLPNQWSWQVIALHPAEGELPAFLELRLNQP